MMRNSNPSVHDHDHDHDLDDALRELGAEIDVWRLSSRPRSPFAGGATLPRTTTRRSPQVAVGIAAVLIAGAGVATVAVIGRDRPPAVTPAAASPATHPDAPPTGARGPTAQGPITELLDGSFPPGFVAVRESSVGTVSVVDLLRADGAHLTVTVAIGGSTEDFRESDLDGAESIPHGRMQEWEQGVLVVTDAGDHLTVTANVGVTGHSDADPKAWLYAELLPDMRAVALLLAAGVDDRTALAISEHRPAVDVAGSARLRHDVEAVLTESGAQILGYGTNDPARFSVSAVPPSGGELFVVAVRTTAALPAGTVTSAPPGSAPVVVAATTMVDGWIVQVVSTARVDGAGSYGSPLEAAAVADLLEQLAEPFRHWEDETPTAAGCETVTVAHGDNLAGIAAANGATLDELRAVNVDLEARLVVGAEITLPCR